MIIRIHNDEVGVCVWKLLNVENAYLTREIHSLGDSELFWHSLMVEGGFWLITIGICFEKFSNS